MSRRSCSCSAASSASRSRGCSSRAGGSPATRRSPRSRRCATRRVYNRARSDAQRKGDIVWSPEVHAELVRGEPAELRSKTKITAEQVLAIGLPDLAATKIAPDSVEARMAAAEASLPPSMRLDILTVIENLLLEDRERHGLQKTLAQLVDNHKAVG